MWSDARLGARAAVLERKQPYVMIHECGDARVGGCEFGHFFSQAARIDKLQSLIDAGLFKPLAVAWHAEPYDAVSRQHAMVALGARMVAQTRLQRGHSAPLCSVTQETSRENPATGAKMGSGRLLFASAEADDQPLVGPPTLVRTLSPKRLFKPRRTMVELTRMHIESSGLHSVVTPVLEDVAGVEHVSKV